MCGIELWAELATLVMEYHFYMKEHVTILADIFLKRNKVSLLLQRKQLPVSVANNKIRAFKQKLEFWKTCTWHHEFDSFPVI